MANFFNANTRGAISTLTIPPGGTATIGLWGGGGQAEELNVTTQPRGGYRDKDPAVKLKSADRANWNFIYTIEASKIASKTLRAVDGNDRDYAGTVTIVVGAADAGAAAARKAIVDEARRHVAQAHYLWGTAGNTPGSSDGNFGKASAATIRAYSLDDKATERDKVLAVCTAVQPVFDGYNTCAGRCMRANVQNTGQTLATYLAARREDAAKGVAESSWQGGAGGLHPRKYYFRGDLKNNGAPVWGESCYGRRHFDCIGLVNYCYGKQWKSGNFAVSIPQVREPNSGFVAVGDSAAAMDADIIIPKGGNKHIAMLYEAGGGAFRIVQAEDTIYGLTDQAAYDPTAWDRFRMQGAYLKS